MGSRVVSLLAAAAVLGALGVAPSKPAEAAAVKRMCKGKVATVIGGPGKNTLLGTDGRDVIHAGGGMDAVWGGGGRDIVCGGRGADVLDGGRGADRLYGNTGIDACFGEGAEHVNHFGCEAHLPSYDAVDSPDTTARNLSSLRAADPVPAGAPAAPTAATIEPSTPRTRATTRQQAGHWLVPGSPWCSTQEIRGFPLTISGWYTTPAYVAVRPIVSYMTNAGWTAPSYGEWTIMSLPSGNGTAYPAYANYIYTMPRHARTHWGIEAYWWNGFAWVDRQAAIINRYEWQRSGTPATAFCDT